MAHPDSKPNPPSDEPASMLITLKNLRTAVGAIALLLPLGAGALSKLNGLEGWPETLSDSYHTGAQDVFVGSLCALAIFFGCYRGPQPIDRRLSLLAAICALIVAFCPTRLAPAPVTPLTVLHLVGAATLFLTLAGFCLCLFPRSNQPLEDAGRAFEFRRKLTRNRIYRTCGWTILGAMLLIGIRAVTARWFHVELGGDSAVFWLESIAVWAFGLSWLTKSEAFKWLASD